MTKAIIIDDETHCIETLTEKIKLYCPYIEIVHSFNKPLLALDYLDNEEHPDVIFLDIEMPVINGFSLIERVKKLEQHGIIQSYHAQLDREKVGLGVTTFIQVSLVGHKKDVTESFVKRVKEIPEIIECHHITGSGDFLLKVISKDIASYQKLLLECINEIEEVANTQTMVILSTFKESKVLPIPY